MERVGFAGHDPILTRSLGSTMQRWRRQSGSSVTAVLGQLGEVYGGRGREETRDAGGRTAISLLLATSAFDGNRGTNGAASDEAIKAR